MKLDKERLLKAFISLLEEELMTMKSAARDAREAATHEESKPENEYDTRGLEASYLAGAQAKRAAEIDEVISIFKTTAIKNFTNQDPIRATALVELEINNKRSFVLFMPKGGGVAINFESFPVQVITPQSVLGEALLGRKVGDEFEIEINSKVREYQIISIS